jgi:hypothetical protein
MNLGRILAALRRHPLVADLTLAVALAALAAVTGLALVAPRAQVEPPSTPVMVAWAVALAAPLVHCSTDDYGWSVERTAKQLFPYATCIELAAQDTWSSQLVGPHGLGELL